MDSRFRRLARRLSGGQDASLGAQPSQEAACTPVGELADRAVCRCTGTVASVSQRPAGSKPPGLVVELADGDKLLTLVWLGRREIVGIRPGVRLTVNGRVSFRRGNPVMFNPRYEIQPHKAR